MRRRRSVGSKLVQNGIHQSPRVTMPSRRGQNARGWRARSCRLHELRLLTAFVNRQFFVEPGDHLANPGFRQALGGCRMLALEALYPTFQVRQLFLSFLILILTGE